MSDIAQNQQDQQSAKSNAPNFSIDDLMRAGVYFGHRKSARNPKMIPNIYGAAGNIHIIDVRRSYFALSVALEALRSAAKDGKRILFVSTNPKFSDQVKEVAEKCGQYYVRRWRGGMLTNWRTIVSSIKTLKRYNSKIEKIESDPSDAAYTKKELLRMRIKRDKLERSFGGIIDMGRMPDLVVVFSVWGEKMAINETRCIGTPVIGIADTNSDPSKIKYPIPGNDDSLRAMEFYCKMFSEAILDGTKEWIKKEGLKLNAVIDEKTNTIITHVDQASGAEGGKRSIHSQEGGDTDQIKMKSKSQRSDKFAGKKRPSKNESDRQTEAKGSPADTVASDKGNEVQSAASDKDLKSDAGSVSEKESPSAAVANAEESANTTSE